MTDRAERAAARRRRTWLLALLLALLAAAQVVMIRSHHGTDRLPYILHWLTLAGLLVALAGVLLAQRTRDPAP